MIIDSDWVINQYPPDLTFSQYSAVVWLKNGNGKEFWGWGESPEKALKEAKRKAGLK